MYVIFYKQWVLHIFSAPLATKSNLSGIPSPSLRLTVFGVESPRWDSRAASGSARRCWPTGRSPRRRPPFSPPSDGGRGWRGRRGAGSCSRSWTAGRPCALPATFPSGRSRSGRNRGWNKQRDFIIDLTLRSPRLKRARNSDPTWTDAPLSTH